MPNPKNKKKKSSPQKPPTWKKIEDFIYTIEDPVTKGTWRYIGGREMSEFELFHAVTIYMQFYGGVRPKKGKYVEIQQPLLQ